MEEATLWSFAKLKEIPSMQQIGGAPLYFSQSRVCSPAAHEWLSVDPLVQWNPAALVSRPGNWHSVRYAASRPLELLDPSGQFIETAIDVASLAA